MSRLIAGARAVEEALRSAEPVEEIFYTASRKEALSKLLEHAERRGVPAQAIGRSALDKMASGVRHQGVVAKVRAFSYLHLDELWRERTPHCLLVALDGITDPQNFGAIIRSAVALGAAGLIVTKDRAAPISGATIRSSAGATEHANIAQVVNLSRALSTLAEEGLQVVGLAGEAQTSLKDLGGVPAEGRVVVIGSEGKGLRRLVRERCTTLARIELAGPIDSLNASVAAALAMYESRRA